VAESAVARARLLVIMGSGEMAARMSRVHRSVIRRLAGGTANARDVSAAVIDTPYGFQSNADALTATAVDFFGRRLGIAVAVASFRRADDDVLTRETALERIHAADLIFSGPGSPSYALRHWSGTPMAALLADKLASGGALVFASAAALALGRLTVPVYEIYKAGEDPFWLPGLDVLSSIGLKAAVIPHFDNTEGGGHDTRYAFLGERRLRRLEEMMPRDVFVLGIDEHTALIVDLDEQRVSVRGRGGVTVRVGGASETLAAGAEMSLEGFKRLAGRPHSTPTDAYESVPRVDEAVEVSDVRALVRAALAEDDADLTRSRVIRLGAAAESLERDRRRLLQPLVEVLLEVRQAARARSDWETADLIRDRLVNLGVKVSDAADGTTDYNLPPLQP
jgi:cyanophycinase-like exopeptidase